MRRASAGGDAGGMSVVGAIALPEEVRIMNTHLLSARPTRHTADGPPMTAAPTRVAQSCSPNLLLFAVPDTALPPPSDEGRSDWAQWLPYAH